MEYTAPDVKKLREETGATFADCKKALTESKNWDEAIKYLEARSATKAEKVATAGRETKEGGVFSYVHHNNSVGVLLELNCSTDFVARSESFRNLARDLTHQIVGTAPKYVSYEDVPAEVVEETRKKLLEDPSMERIAPDKREIALEGKLKKHFAAQVLMMQTFIKDDAVVVGDLVRKVIADTGENIIIRRFSYFKLGEE
jgi:elongation factor Ts